MTRAIWSGYVSYNNDKVEIQIPPNEKPWRNLSSKFIIMNMVPGGPNTRHLKGLIWRTLYCPLGIRNEIKRTYIKHIFPFHGNQMFREFKESQFHPCHMTSQLAPIQCKWTLNSFIQRKCPFDRQQRRCYVILLSSRFGKWRCCWCSLWFCGKHVELDGRNGRNRNSHVLIREWRILLSCISSCDLRSIVIFTKKSALWVSWQQNRNSR